jgi:high affinity Mn2+ porin
MIAAFVLLAAAAVTPAAQPSPSLSPASEASAPAVSPSPTAAPQRFNVYVQATNTQQYHGGFAAAYSGAQSLYSGPDTAKTLDITLFLGARLWKNGEVYLNPELDQGFGLGQPSPPGIPYAGTLGVAGFVSGEAYKVGRDSSYARVQKAFLRQTFDLGGGAPQSIEPGINQLGGSIDPRSLVITAGKFAVTDVFDNNVYAHDPKHDFLNWTIIDMGAFDYAADAWGYTYGVSAEYTDANSTFRGGLFQLSKVPNEIAIESIPFDEYSPMFEAEQRTSFFGGRHGAIKGLMYADIGYMGPYAQAVSAAAGTGMPPSTAGVRTAKHVKFGGGINIAQEIVPDVGFFARLSAMNGTYEAYEFTDVDRALSTGVSVDGNLYHRPHDSFGIAGSFNAISAPAQQYFRDGGLGILVGDGNLSYGGEEILETYYSLGVTRYFNLTLDYQFVTNPAYNTVRGPVSVFGLRYHAQF